MRVRRRHFLGTVVLVFAGLGRRLFAQGVGLRFRPLARPVAIPLDDKATAWRAKQFIAVGVTLSTAATPNQPIRIAGMVVRTAAGGDQPDRFAAVCARCPHEGCDVEWIDNPGEFICPCHDSRFGPDGARLSGPAESGLTPIPVRVVEGVLQIQPLDDARSASPMNSQAMSLTRAQKRG
jgi:Rieske Fe-S protein